MNFTPATKSKLRQITSKLLSYILIFLSLSTVTAITLAAPAQALSACAIGSCAQNSLTVQPSQPTVMYIDSGVTPRIDASYVGYRITNGTGSTISGYWAALDNFAGGVISPTNPLDRYIEIPDLASNASTTVYYYRLFLT